MLIHKTVSLACYTTRLLIDVGSGARIPLPLPAYLLGVQVENGADGLKLCHPMGSGTHNPLFIQVTLKAGRGGGSAVMAQGVGEQGREQALGRIIPIGRNIGKRGVIWITRIMPTPMARPPLRIPGMMTRPPVLPAVRILARWDDFSAAT